MIAKDSKLIDLEMLSKFKDKCDETFVSKNKQLTDLLNLGISLNGDTLTIGGKSYNLASGGNQDDTDFVTNYSVSNIVANGGQNIAADATSFNVTFIGITTKSYESGKVVSTSEQVTYPVSVVPNESTSTKNINGDFEWNGVTVEWSAVQEAVEGSISQEALDLIEYYGVERTDEQIAAVDTFLKELKEHTAYSNMQYIILPILAPQSDRTSIETEIANQADKDTSQYPEMQKAFRNIISGTTFDMNIRSWFVGKNGVRIYKKNAAGRMYTMFNESIEFDTANISGGICTTIANKSGLVDNVIRQTACQIRVDGTSWSVRDISFPDSSLPKMYASSVSGKSVKASLNGASSNAIADFSYADGSTTTYTTNRFLRINSSSTSDGLSTSFDDPNGIAISAAFLCKDYAMSQDELNSITNIFRKLILSFWED